MSVGIEVTELTGVDLWGSLPCECRSCLRLLFVVRQWTCGKPSAARAIVRCLACGDRGRFFLCRMHLRLFLNGRLVRCRRCGAVGRCVSALA